MTSMTAATTSRLTGNHPEWCFTHRRCIHLDAPTDRRWAVDVQPYMVDIDGTLTRFLRTCPAVLDEALPLTVYIEEFESTAGGSQGPDIILRADPDENMERRLSADDARALASALLEHADQLETILGGAL